MICLEEFTAKELNMVAEAKIMISIHYKCVITEDSFSVASTLVVRGPTNLFIHVEAKGSDELATKRTEKATIHGMMKSCLLLQSKRVVCSAFEHMKS